MADKARQYLAGTRSALIAFSQGSCYEPSCDEPLIRIDPDGGSPYNNFDTAHIRDANPGNRYDPDMDDDERRHFSNLVLLCRLHHNKVDRTHKEDYPPAVLEEWKRLAAAPGLDTETSISEDDLVEVLLEAFSSAIGPAAVAGELAALARSNAALLQVGDRYCAEISAIDTGENDERNRLPQLTGVQDGRPVRLETELPLTTKRAYQSERDAATASALHSHDGAAETLAQNLAALEAISPVNSNDHVDWLQRSIRDYRAAILAARIDEVQSAKGELQSAFDAICALVRGAEPPSPPAGPEPQTPPEPDEADVAAAEISDLWERCMAAQGHDARRTELIDELRRIGPAASIAAPVPPTFQDAIGICGYFFARYLFEIHGPDDSVAAISEVEPFAFRFEALRQLWFLCKDDPGHDATTQSIETTGVLLLEAESEQQDAGLLGSNRTTHIVSAHYLWADWSGSDDGPKQDLLKTLAGDQLCDVLATFANEMTIGEQTIATFYSGIGRAKENPVPFIADELVEAIREQFPGLEPAPRIPLREAPNDCFRLASEYLALVS